MDYQNKGLLSQVKSEHLVHNNVTKLFRCFRLENLLQISGLTKEKGYTPIVGWQDGFTT